MPKQSNILQLIRKNKTVFILIGIGLFLIELEIFAIAAMRSGRTARLQVLNDRGDLIYEADGTQLTEFNKYYFEKTFGPLESYHVQLLTSVEPFPFRAWLQRPSAFPWVPSCCLVSQSRLMCPWFIPKLHPARFTQINSITPKPVLSG